MKHDKLSLVYFSATSTTRKVLRYIAEGINIKDVTEYNITNGQEEVITFKEDELVIFGTPVFSGRVPEIAVDSLKKFKGTGTPAIVVCVYGNRDFEDALLELQTIAIDQLFEVFAAGAFIAQHSIFPQTGQGRPDLSDKATATEFGTKAFELLESTEDIKTITPIGVTGNYPYRETLRIPLTPRTSKKCNLCGSCTRQCPMQAIEPENPRTLDKERCISCAHCIAICPQKAKHFGGLLYFLASIKFKKTYANRQEPYLVIGE